MDNEFQTTELHGLLSRMHRGDEGSREELVNRILSRVTFLARRMLRHFPGVHRMEQTDDVVQGTLIRLMRSLETIKPASMREFFGLANEQVRRELLDLVKRYQAAKRPPLQYLPQAPHDKSGGGWEPPANDASQFELDSWQRFHEAITQLPDEEREVMSLIFYQGWTQKDVASFLDVSDRQVRRYWTSACKTLREQLHGELPTL